MAKQLIIENGQLTNNMKATVKNSHRHGGSGFSKVHLVGKNGDLDLKISSSFNQFQPISSNFNQNEKNTVQKPTQVVDFHDNFRYFLPFWNGRTEPGQALV